jgi:hypothetical protein
MGVSRLARYTAGASTIAGTAAVARCAALSATGRFGAASAFLSAAAHRRLVAATIHARPSGLRLRFFLAAFAGSGVAAAVASRAAAHRFRCAAAMGRRVNGF